MTLKLLFEEQEKHLKYFFENIDIQHVTKISTLLNACSGVLFFTGVGKSGLVAEKIALTMTSLGTPSFYLSPLNALHGDIGIVKKGDIFILFSKSGESEELLNLVPYARNKGATLIAVVCRENSRLSKACDESIVLPLERELCPFNLVPTTSAVIQMIFGDILAIALMNLKDFSIEQYALNHPLGSIGRRITLRVKDLMVKDEKIPLCKPEDMLVNTLVELSEKACGCVLVVDDKNTLVGIFTDGDLRRALQNKGSEVLHNKMKDLMTQTPHAIDDDALAVSAIELMESDQKHPITVLPVVDKDHRVLGLVKMHDLIQSGLR